MPVQQCQSDGAPGYKYGPEGTCYTYDPADDASRAAALAKAHAQGRAIEASRHERP